MYCDLNIRKKGQTQQDPLFLQLLTSCIEDNYEAVGINHHFKDIILQPKDASQFVQVDAEELQKRIDNSLTLQQFVMKPKLLKQFSRITLDISDGKYLHQVNDQNKIIQSYDIVAIKPRSEKVMLSLLNDFDFFDIITFDCYDKLPFIPKQKHVRELISKGVYFELNYGDAIQDTNRRRSFISNANILIQSTRGRNIVLSSDTDNWLYHRSPYDLVALGITLGLKKDSSYQALSTNPMAVIARSRHRKAYKGTISLAEPADIAYFQQKQREIEDKETDQNRNIVKQLKRIRKKIKISSDAYSNQERENKVQEEHN